jgi:hypothetical protein
MARHYTAPDGTQYPLTEARYNMVFKVYRSDRRKAVPGDPENCLAARGIRRDKDVLAVYIGSGKDAYVVFKASKDEDAHAVHFVIKTATRRLVDAFDKDRAATTQQIILHKPTPGRTLENRDRLNKDRHRRIRAGEHQPKRRERPNVRRVARLGVGHRPRAKISRSGNVSMQEEQLAAE